MHHELTTSELDIAVEKEYWYKSEDWSSGDDTILLVVEWIIIWILLSVLVYFIFNY